MKRLWRYLQHRLDLCSGVTAPGEFVTNKFHELGFRQGATVYWFRQSATPVVDTSGEWEALPPKVVRRPTERLVPRA